ncbi:IS3 family transposase [Streptomyces sp. NPDC051561]|uniref:IS3 family transposase n=1 Tax=Streptomyces sp. NPDC051561 TaxID=3365658 RepID=UPI0037B80408
MPNSARLGRRINRKRVERIMRENGIQGAHRRHRRSLTRPDKKARPAPDLIGRDFQADAPGTKLVGDITYLPTTEGWLYLACWLDLATREVVGYAMADHHRASLVVDALKMAHGRAALAPGCIAHSDRGSDYTSEPVSKPRSDQRTSSGACDRKALEGPRSGATRAFRQRRERACQAAGARPGFRHRLSAEFRLAIGQLEIRQSCGRTGSCFDNATAESFWALLTEEIGTRLWPDRATARAEVFAFIETFYNRRHLRKQKVFGHLTPAETRQRHQHALAA